MTLGVRSYGNSLLMQNIYDFDALPTVNPILSAFSEKILNPRFTCVEADCQTTIGRRVNIPEVDVVGLYDLNTNRFIIEADIIRWLTNGIFTARLRDASSCLSSGGFCAICGNGYFAREGSGRSAEVGQSYVMSSPARSYQNYVAETFSGSLLGFSPLTAFPLSSTAAKWDLITDHVEMDAMCRQLEIMNVNSDELAYIYTIEDILERALAIIGTYGVYGNA